MARLVKAWESGPDATRSAQVQAMIKAEVARIQRAFARLPIQVTFVDHDPYGSFEQMRDQVQSTRTMLIYKGFSDTPLWDEHTNWQARAVHDWDHIQKSLDFSMESEAAAYRSSAERMPGLAPLYLSEIMLQAAVANYTGDFVPQKLVIVPEEDHRYATSLRGGKRKPVKPAAPYDAAELVYVTAGLLRVGTPENAMVHLGARGVAFPEALIILDAAQQFNAKMDSGPNAV